MPAVTLENGGHLWEVPPDPTGSSGEGSSSDSLAALSQTQHTVTALALHPRSHCSPPPACIQYSTRAFSWDRQCYRKVFIFPLG